jgi:hypothetical protein
MFSNTFKTIFQKKIAETLFFISAGRSFFIIIKIVKCRKSNNEVTNPCFRHMIIYQNSEVDIVNQRNAAIFPFPTVQYIPLTITNQAEGPIPKMNQAKPGNPVKPVLRLIAGPELASWQTALIRDYGIAIPKSLPPGTCPVCAIHLQITEVKYRGFFVTMLGTEERGNYQLFTIPSNLFYKPKLFFQVFDPVSAKQLASCSLFMPITNELQAKG